MPPAPDPFVSPVPSRADVWRNEAQPPANAALLLCNRNGQVKGAKESACDRAGFGRLEDQEAKDGEAVVRRALAPLRAARIWQPGTSDRG